MPIRQIADRILRESTAEDSLILVDNSNADPIAMLYALHPQRTFLRTGLPATSTAFDLRLANPRVRKVWFFRNTHDVSPGLQNNRYQARLRAQMIETVYPFEPYTALERFLMQRLDGAAPRYFQRLLEYQRQPHRSPGSFPAAN
ncbi:MAG: hypothetical protein ABI759_16610 [Candidatus Solibacter sp.]